MSKSEEGAKPMNAIQFIKEHGVDKARKVIDGAPDGATHFTEALGGHYAKEGMLKMKPQWLWFNSINKEWYYDFAAKDHIHLPDLKRLVESVDLVNLKGGVKKLKKEADCLFHNDVEGVALRYEQAIADYELIYCVADMGDDSHIENHISPLCKVGVK